MKLIAIIARLWPFANGSGRIIDRFGRKIDLGSGERRVLTSDGFPITVLEDDLIGRHIILSGHFDRSIVQVLLDRAEPGDTLIDIGANIGYVSGCFLANVPGSRVICFEPQPHIVDLLRRNLAEFGSCRSVIHHTALSDRDGTAAFRVNQANRGASRLEHGGEIEVPIVEAGKFFRNTERANLIKIDVEGHELPILQSILPQLERLRPRAILYEDQTAAREIERLLASLGYRVFAIEKTLFHNRLTEGGTANDYLALLS